MPLELSRKRVVARKPHKCFACSTIAVQPGDEYTRSSNLYDGRVYSLVTCTGCAAMISDVFEWAGEPDEGVAFDEFVDWSFDHRHEDDRARAYLDRVGWSE